MSSLAFDRCIFCKAPKTIDDDFTDEHSVPLALGGKMLLRKATCNSCRDLTGKIEAKVLRGAMRAYRIKAGLPSRSKTPPATLPIFAVNGEADARLEIPINDYPTLLPLPHFSGPAILQGGRVNFEPKEPWLGLDSEALERLFEKYPIESFATMSLDATSFGKMLCKIAHCLAIHQFGLTFSPYVYDAIQSAAPHNYLKYVGTAEAGTTSAPGSPVQHNYRFYVTDVLGCKLLVATVTLFANFGAPKYRVLIGEFEAPFEREPRVTCEDIVRPEHRGDWFRCMLAKSPRPDFKSLAPDATFSTTLSVKSQPD